MPSGRLIHPRLNNHTLQLNEILDELKPWIGTVVHGPNDFKRIIQSLISRSSLFPDTKIQGTLTHTQMMVDMTAQLHNKTTILPPIYK